MLLEEFHVSLGVSNTVSGGGSQRRKCNSAEPGMRHQGVKCYKGQMEGEDKTAGRGMVLNWGLEKKRMRMRKMLGGSKVEVGIPIQSQNHSHLHSYTVHCESKVTFEPPSPGEVLSTFVSRVTTPSIPQRPHLLHQGCSDPASPSQIHYWNLLPMLNVAFHPWGCNFDLDFF